MIGSFDLLSAYTNSYDDFNSRYNMTSGHVETVINKPRNRTKRYACEFNTDCFKPYNL